MFRKGNLTYRAWLPYDYCSSTIVFCLTYAHQLISLTVGSLVNVACDSLIGGLLMQICCQFEILECRLNKISNDHNTLRDCVRHHESILELVVLSYHSGNILHISQKKWRNKAYINKKIPFFVIYLHLIRSITILCYYIFYLLFWIFLKKFRKSG